MTIRVSSVVVEIGSDISGLANGLKMTARIDGQKTVSYKALNPLPPDKG
jgi:hypothetical protein